MNIEQVLNEYRNGNENRRLSLFLFYREFRDEFSRIDDEELGAERVGTRNRKRRMFMREPTSLRKSPAKNSPKLLKLSFLLGALRRALDKWFSVCYDATADENAENRANSGIE